MSGPELLYVIGALWYAGMFPAAAILKLFFSKGTDRTDMPLIAVWPMLLAMLAVYYLLKGIYLLAKHGGRILLIEGPWAVYQMTPTFQEIRDARTAKSVQQEAQQRLLSAPPYDSLAEQIESLSKRKVCDKGCDPHTMHGPCFGRSTGEIDPDQQSAGTPLRAAVELFDYYPGITAPPVSEVEQ